jgi:hypothetical protein
LLFNAREDFARKVIPGIAAAGGDVDRVFRASQGLLRASPADGLPSARLFWGNTGGTKVHLHHDEGMLNSLHNFLRHRPSIRLVVIDQANLHLRCGSERQFDVVVQGLLRIAQECEVAVVLTMQPDAFRRAEGVSKYLQSRSLKENAHSVWRLAPPTDPEIPGRVLEIVKTSHGVADLGQQAWHLVQSEDHRLEWNVADGTELAPSKDLLKHRDLVRVQEFLDQILFVLGGLAWWHVLVERAAHQGISQGLLRQALTYWNLPSMFEPHEGDLRELVGYPELIALRKQELWAQQAAARAALLSGRSPFAVGLGAGVAAGLGAAAGAGLAPPPASTTAGPPRQPSPEPRTSPAASGPVSAPGAEAASFIKPEVVAGGDEGEEPELEGAAAGRNGGKSPTAPPKKVAQAL